MAKGQISVGIGILAFILLAIAVIFFAVFILKSLGEVEEEVTNTGIDNFANNTIDEIFGEPVLGTDNITKKQKANNPDIAEPGLAG